VKWWVSALLVVSGGTGLWSASVLGGGGSDLVPWVAFGRSVLGWWALWWRFVGGVRWVTLSMVALDAESGGDGRRRKIEGRERGGRRRGKMKINLLHECFQVCFFFFKKKKRRVMCHICRDGKDNDKRMDRSISPFFPWSGSFKCHLPGQVSLFTWKVFMLGIFIRILLCYLFEMERILFYGLN
jgi:hypothetical protein